MSELKTHNGGIDPMSFDEPASKKGTNPMVFDTPTKSVEEKLYIVFVDMANDLFDGKFKICKGRTECFRYIETLCESFGTDFDPHTSKVITETKQTETKTENTKYYLINLEDSISVYSFCKSVEGFYGKNDFKIDDYFNPPVTADDGLLDSNEAFKEQGVHRVYRDMLNGVGIQNMDSTGLHILKDEGDEEVNV